MSSSIKVTKEVTDKVMLEYDPNGATLYLVAWLKHGRGPDMPGFKRSLSREAYIQ